MRFKRVIATFVSAALLLGFAGCDAFGIRKAMGVMNDRLINYNKALNELDYEAVRNLSDWTETDPDYAAVEKLFDTSDYGDAAGEGYIACTEYIASTIKINFNVTGATIKYDQAALEVTYEMVDWQQVYSEPHDSYDEVLEDLKNCPDKMAIVSDVTFENVDGENDWRLCVLSDLGEVMSFVHSLPDVTG